MGLPSENWYYARTGQKAGPVTLAQLRLLLHEGHLDRETDLVWAEGSEDWVPASRIPGLVVEAPPLAGLGTPRGGPGVPFVKEARFGLLLLCFGVGLLLGIGGVLGIYWSEFRGLNGVNGLLGKLLTVASATALAVSLGFLVLGIVLVCIYLYRAWHMLQPFSVPLTPVVAVGFLFVPVFNLYWSFQALWGWARTYNRVIDNDPTFEAAPRVNPHTFLALCLILILRVFARVLLAVSGGSYPLVLSLALLSNLAMLVLGLVCAYQLCAAVNCFANLHSERRAY